MLLAVALFVRLLVPDGFMPSGGTDHFRLTFCSGGAMASRDIVLLRHTGDAPHHLAKTCDFAHAAAPMVGVNGATADTPSDAALVVLRSTILSDQHSPSRFPRPQSQAPPALMA